MAKFYPLRKGTYELSSGYGPRWGTHHNGLDFAAPLGTEIVAPVDMLIIEGSDRAAGSVGGFGNWVWGDAQTEHGVDLIFGHMRHHEIYVKAGDRVRAGQVIARVGSEGGSTGPHLHFEVWGPPGRVGGVHRDPGVWLKDAVHVGDSTTAEPAPVSSGGPMIRLVDYAAGRPGAAAIKAAGFQGAVRYLVASPDRGLPNKVLTADEVADFKANGLTLVSNWQRGKHATADWRRGFEGGVADAREALTTHFALGGTGYTPIYFSVDEDVNLDTWNSLVLPYLNGCASILGKEWVGVYGGQRSMWWAEEDGFRWRWQTKGWSRYDSQGRWNASLPVQWVDGCQLRQVRVDEDRINGIGVDVNEVHAADFGQWGVDRSPGKHSVPAPAPVPPAKAPEVVVQDPITRTQISPNKHGGGRNVSWVVIHTQEANSTAANLVNYCCNPNSQVSYNAVVDDEESVLVVPWDLNPWSAANANPRGDHICLAGSFAKWGRDKWLSTDASDGLNEDAMLNRAAALVAWRCTVRGIPIEYVGGKGMPTRNGVCGHRDFGAWGGGHTDPGDGFPWDELIRRAQVFQQGGDFTVAEADRVIEFIQKFVAPIGSDVKDIRHELVGDRDNPVYPELQRDFTGHPSLYDLRAGKADPFRGTTTRYIQELDAKVEALVQIVSALATKLDNDTDGGKA